MSMQWPDLTALWLSFKLAGLTTVVLILLTTPLAYWLAKTQSKLKPLIETLVALPIVLPPTVMGFYLLVLLGPDGWLGAFWVSVTGSALTFSFSGLVIASVCYSLPFVVQPLQNGFESINPSIQDAAKTLGTRGTRLFFKVTLPLSKRAFLTAAVMGFAHTLGEFGVVLMVGGNIPGATKVIAIEIYNQVEMLNYPQAHVLSAILLVLAFVMIFALYYLNQSNKPKQVQ
ncbi:molybdate ABC transporter permease subunit [Marinicella sp. S1101]|uniref:molybdate ABC transporter permease subunit n=1 Tax=Marinicella marina TaxID=2996016 RepID=UPI002260F156|nr:molybdate ABC transporter permease subunit [Marinicella marina]MCX7552438.1 molybdate ABC transporter permease subunit [Marinicella marina]MDJ1139313.1 molybdate ABC transporter permease subunit [Marinicella marina]